MLSVRLFTDADRNGLKAAFSGASYRQSPQPSNFLFLSTSYLLGLRLSDRSARGAARVVDGAETARDKWEFQSRLRRNRISRVPFLAPSLPAFLTNFFFFLRPRAFLIGAFDRRTDGRREEGAPAHLPFSSFANR